MHDDEFDDSVRIIDKEIPNKNPGIYGINMFKHKFMKTYSNERDSN